MYESSSRGLPDKELLGVEEIAEYFGVKKSTVWRWSREGRIPCLKVGKGWRIRREELEDFLKRTEGPGVSKQQTSTLSTPKR